MEIIKNRESLVEKFINDITDEPNPDILYHFTKSNAIYSILVRNELVAMQRSQVSFTSSKDYYEAGNLVIDRLAAVLVFDATKLSKDYDIVRFEDEQYEDEYEWVIKSSVHNIQKYLIKIGNINMYERDIIRIKKKFPDIEIENW